eukprot:TRINITY_DN63085_c0_g1_i1.p1 TRINITY_DN63085_c0_g1~~TRINITY_DN63085_c0_g1_i1.p1  ORF type:complete len:191 (-),score=21.88 TRINITY_DN63085_c0_g1_i1:209-781(-)
MFKVLLGFCVLVGVFGNININLNNVVNGNENGSCDNDRQERLRSRIVDFIEKFEKFEFGGAQSYADFASSLPDDVGRMTANTKMFLTAANAEGVLEETVYVGRDAILAFNEAANQRATDSPLGITSFVDFQNIGWDPTHHVASDVAIVRTKFASGATYESKQFYSYRFSAHDLTLEEIDVFAGPAKQVSS